MDITEDQLNICAWAMIGTATVITIISQFITIPYGRYSRANWGFGINSQIAWLLQESPSFLVPSVLLFLNSRHQKLTPNVVLLSMFLFHYFRRSFIYPFTIKKNTQTPFIPFVFAFMFCSINGYMQGQYLTRLASYPDHWFYNPLFVTGTLLFFLGFGVNVHSDSILTNLRKPGETGHQIPRGGLFEYVSGANFFGEIVEWAGFALACSSFVAFAFFLITVATVGTRAYHHHRRIFKIAAAMAIYSIYNATVFLKV